MRSGVEREAILVGNVVRVHSVAQRRLGSKTRHQDASGGAQADIHDVVDEAAPTERPAGVIAPQRTQAVLLRQRGGGNGKVDARDVGHEDAQEIGARSGSGVQLEYALQDSRNEERIGDEGGELLVVGRLLAVPVVLHRQRNQEFHGERVAYAVHLHVLAEVAVLADVPQSYQLAKRRSPGAYFRVGILGVGGHRAIGGGHSDRHLDGDQADVVARESIGGGWIGGAWAGIGGARQHGGRRAKVHRVKDGGAIEVESVIPRAGEYAHPVREREHGLLPKIGLVIRGGVGAQVRGRHGKRMAVGVFVEVIGLTGLQIPHHYGVSLIEKDASAIDAVDLPEVRNERRIGTQQCVENNIDLLVRAAIQVARVIDVEPVQNAVGELVIARTIVRSLEPLGAHAHNQPVALARFVAAEQVEIVEVGGLIFENQRSIAMAGCKGRHAQQNGRSSRL